MNTLIDGLLVEDADQGTKVMRYLAFDIVFLDGAPIWQKKLEKRLQCLQNEVILARKNVRPGVLTCLLIASMATDVVLRPRTRRLTMRPSRSACA